MAKANILFVEDSETQGSETKKFLEKSGYAVVWVLEGMPALRIVKTQPFDVILIDCILPDIDGTKICGCLKQDEDTKGIPIIMLTAKATTADKVLGLDSGADDYLSKPYEKVELCARISAALRTKFLQDDLKRKSDEIRGVLAKVAVLSVTDPLTGLYNRRHFEELLESEFKKALRYKTPLSCMMIDIDHFKVVNDTHGHAVGDAVITDIAQIIRQNIRNVDTPCRWGGEEFIVLTPMTAKAFVEQSARRILKCISDHVFTAIGGQTITVSIGIADVSKRGIDTPYKLIHAADIVMYEAKQGGRNRICIAT
jgi:two-component system, cell cycle response regulator